MLKNGNYYVDPPEGDLDFSELFQYAAIAGAGQPQFRHNEPVPPWDAVTLADQILSLSADGRAVDLRTIQNWFQDNHRAPNARNLELLAQIFGCGEPESTTKWRQALRFSKSVSLKRRSGKTNFIVDARHETEKNERVAQPNSLSTDTKLSGLASKCAAAFSGSNSFHVIVFMFAFCISNVFINVIFGTHTVSYSLAGGIEKQVGLIYAPTWTILPALVLPSYILVASDLMTWWKDYYPTPHKNSSLQFKTTSWIAKLDSYSFSFWTILIVNVVFVFGLQWIDISKQILANDSTQLTQIDRNLISVIRPDVINTTAAIFVAMLGYMFTAFYIWTFLTVMLCLYILSDHFKQFGGEWQQSDMYSAGSRLVSGIFRCAVLGISIALCIKLQVAYLSTNSPDIVTWVVTDFTKVLGISNSNIDLISGTTITHFTTFLMVLITCMVFFLSMITVNRSLNKNSKPRGGTSNIYLSNSLRMSLVILTLSFSTISMGQFSGFSLLIIGYVFISVYSVLNPQLGSKHDHVGTSAAI